MKKKYKDIYFCILIILITTLILTTYLVPIVRFKAMDNSEIVVADGVFTIIKYLNQQIYLATDAYNIFFNGGPIWLSVLGICLNFLITAFSIVVLVLCIFELITKNNKSITAKQNNITKKLVLFFGYFTLFSQIFTILSFVITTLTSNGYAVYIPSFECYISLAISIAVVIIGHLIKKDKFEQKNNSKIAMYGFAGSAVFCVLCVAFLFLPQISKEVLLGENTSLFEFAMQANNVGGYVAPYGDFAFGLAQYTIFALIISAIFILTYSIIGFLKASKNKDTTWLSIRIKRWTLAFLITNTILYVFIIGGVCACMSTTYLEGDFLFLTTSFFNVFIIFVPYVFATSVPLNKKIKQNKGKYYKI